MFCRLVSGSDLVYANAIYRYFKTKFVRASQEMRHILFNGLPYTHTAIAQSSQIRQGKFCFFGGRTEQKRAVQARALTYTRRQKNKIGVGKYLSVLFSKHTAVFFGSLHSKYFLGGRVGTLHRRGERVRAYYHPLSLFNSNTELVQDPNICHQFPI